jgi:hypothetical protein
MNSLLQKYNGLVLNANPNNEKYIYHLEFKKNDTFRLIKVVNNDILYDSYGDYIIDDNNYNIILTFTELEEEFHNIKKINVTQTLKYKIIEEEKVFEDNDKKYKSLYTIIFDKCPNPFNYNFPIINNENIFYCNLGFI